MTQTDQTTPDIPRKEQLMSETKHTPGPWLIDDECEIGGIGAWKIMSPSTVRPEGAFPVAFVTGIDTNVFPDAGWDDANARLVSLAPEMLAALEELISAAKAYGTAVYYEDADVEEQAIGMRVIAAIEAGEAVLARAKGGAS